MSGPSIKLEYDFNYVEWVTQFYFKYDSYILVVVLGSVCFKVLLCMSQFVQKYNIIMACMILVLNKDVFFLSYTNRDAR